MIRLQSATSVLRCSSCLLLLFYSPSKIRCDNTGVISPPAIAEPAATKAILRVGSIVILRSRYYFELKSLHGESPWVSE